MMLRKLVLLLIVGALVIAGGRWARDPHRTALPFGTPDLSSVKVQLATLPADERALVEAYVARSRGDYLVPKFADPDEPFTARTFGEAIALQREWEVRKRASDADADKRREARDARLAPLRALVDASIVRAEISTESERRARLYPDSASAPQRDEIASFVTRVRVRNVGSQSIVEVKGSLQARDRDAHLPLSLCWVEVGNQKEIAPGEATEFDCGWLGRHADEQQKAFIEDTDGRFEVVWEPQYVRLADGRELDGGR